MTELYELPAAVPCRFCPLRRDVPSGVWSAHEYEKLRGFDLPTGEQPAKVFFCHKNPDQLCAGWVAVIDVEASMGLRVAAQVFGRITVEGWEALKAYTTSVPVFSTFAEAADHGMVLIDAPDEQTDAARRLLLLRHGRLMANHLEELYTREKEWPDVD